MSSYQTRFGSLTTGSCDPGLVRALLELLLHDGVGRRLDHVAALADDEVNRLVLERRERSVGRRRVAQHHVRRAALLRLEVHVRRDVLEHLGDGAGAHGEIERQLVEHEDVGRANVALVGGEDAEIAPRLAGVERQVLHRAEHLLDRERLVPERRELRLHGGERLLRSAGDEGHARARDLEGTLDRLDELDDAALVRDVVGVELHRVDRRLPLGELVRLDRAGVVALLVGEVGEVVELGVRLRDVQLMLGEVVVVLRVVGLDLPPTL